MMRRKRVSALDILLVNVPAMVMAGLAVIAAARGWLLLPVGLFVLAALLIHTAGRRD